MSSAYKLISILSLTVKLDGVTFEAFIFCVVQGALRLHDGFMTRAVGIIIYNFVHIISHCFDTVL